MFVLAILAGNVLFGIFVVVHDVTVEDDGLKVGGIFAISGKAKGAKFHYGVEICWRLSHFVSFCRPPPLLRRKSNSKTSKRSVPFQMFTM